MHAPRRISTDFTEGAGAAMKTATSLAWLGLLLFGGCEFNITNPNSPTAIGPNPSRPEVAAAATGLLIGARQDATNWVLKAGILGREAYRLDVADPRFVTELLVGPLDASNAAFGGGQWAFEYRTVKSGYDLLNVIGTASPTQVTAAEQAAVRGFTRTIQAYAFIVLLDAHTQDSIPIDVN